jgi:hypothetical protein
VIAGEETFDLGDKVAFQFIETLRRVGVLYRHHDDAVVAILIAALRLLGADRSAKEMPSEALGPTVVTEALT